MTLKIVKYLTLLLTLLLDNVYADTQQEINHLLDFVAKTSCQYDRNGTIHSGLEAKDHILKKYEYFKDKIKTAEDFIKYSATQSTISGKKYQIHCVDSGTQFSQGWLLNELENYRNSQKE